MPAKVVDASVIAAIAFSEERRDRAERLIGDDDMYAPFLLRYELISIARRKITEEPSKRQDIMDGLGMAMALPVRLVEVSYPDVLELALAHRLSTYDASYLYVAMTGGMKLVTFDQRLQAAAAVL